MLKVNTIFLLTVFTLISSQFLLAQELSMKVTRCTQVERDQPIQNIFVDADNTKWVGFNGGMYELKACDLAQKTAYPAGKKGVASLRSGNSTLKFSMDELQKLVKISLSQTNAITASYYNEEDDELWLGTQESGVLKLKTFPNLKLMEEIHRDNSKLKSNRIESLFIDGEGVVYIGTDEGILRGKGSKWEWEKNLYNVKRILQNGRDIWILADGDIWVAKNGRNFQNFQPFVAAIEGEILDFTFDSEGYLYLVSQSIAKCDIKADSFEVYGQFQDYLSQYATCVAADKDGGIWIGTRDKGVYFLEKNSAITVNILAENEPTCSKPDNKANLSVKIYGGTEPYTFAWDKGLKGENPKNLTAGIYSLTVSDAEGRKKETSIEIADPSIQLNVQMIADESGPDKKDGKAEVTAKGGKPDYAYTWDNGENSAIARKLNAGSHSVTVTDRNGCTAMGSVNLSAKSAPIAIILQEVEPIKCAENSAATLDLKVTGGKAPFQYKWSDTKFSGTNAKGVSAGDYSVTITDAEGTTKTALINVKAPERISKSIEVDKPASTGNNDGQATVKASGGTGRLSYAWDNGETASTAKKLAPGKHSVTITDENGCTAQIETSISENILPLQANLEVVGELKCAGDKTAVIEIRASGGKAPFTYTWNKSGISGEKPINLGAGDYSVTITDAEGTTKTLETSIKENNPIELNVSVEASASTGSTDGKAEVNASGGAGSFSYAWDSGETKSKAKKLGAGSHSVTVTDKNGCSADAKIEITENILPLQASLAVQSEIKCAGTANAELEVKITGGKSPFTYAWNASSASGENPKNLASGSYEVTVTDAAGSTQVAKTTIKAPEKLEVTARVDAPASTGNKDGKATLTIKGGTGSTKIEWDNGETTVSALKLGPGKHVATVSDANNCTASVSVEISENILPLTINILETQAVVCNGDPTGAIKVEVSGGKGPYAFAWNSPYVKGEAATNLPAGAYEVTMTDAEGTKKTSKISLKEPKALRATIGKRVGALNENAKDGKVLLAVEGGTTPYTFAWDNGETEIEAKKLSVGSHTATVTDANGCQATITCQIKAKILPDLTPDLLGSGEAVRMESLLFDADSTNFREESLPVLDEVYEFLIDNPNIVIEVGGHTNNVPPAEYCDRLSSARAKSVAEYVISKGVDPKRVFYKGYGKNKPFTTNETPLGRKKNQRVEVRVLKVDYGG